MVNASTFLLNRHAPIGNTFLTDAQEAELVAAFDAFLKAHQLRAITPSKPSQASAVTSGIEFPQHPNDASRTALRRSKSCSSVSSSLTDPLNELPMPTSPMQEGCTPLGEKSDQLPEDDCSSVSSLRTDPLSELPMPTSPMQGRCTPLGEKSDQLPEDDCSSVSSSRTDPLSELPMPTSPMHDGCIPLGQNPDLLTEAGKRGVAGSLERGCEQTFAPVPNWLVQNNLPHNDPSAFLLPSIYDHLSGIMTSTSPPSAKAPGVQMGPTAAPSAWEARIVQPFPLHPAHALLPENGGTAAFHAQYCPGTKSLAFEPFGQYGQQPCALVAAFDEVLRTEAFGDGTVTSGVIASLAWRGGHGAETDASWVPAPLRGNTRAKTAEFNPLAKDPAGTGSLRDRLRKRGSGILAQCSR